MDNEDTEISDLQTAKVALHGALAMVRNLQDLNQRLKGDVQDATHREKLTLKREVEAQAAVVRMQGELNQLKVYYAAFESDLKEKARHEAAREEQFKWERQMAKLQESIDILHKSRTLKDEELQRVRDDVQKKDKAISLLLEQGTAAKMRMHAEWAVELERFEAKHAEHLHAIGLEKEKEVQAQWAERFAKLQERCQNLEQELAEKDHLLTQKFHERIQKVLAQGKLREQNLWDQTQRLRAIFEQEIHQRFEQRLAAKEADYKANLVALETRLLDQSAAREKALQLEKEAALDALRQAANRPQLQLKEEMDAFKTKIELEFLERERVLRERYQALERAAADRAQSQELAYLAQLAEEKETLFKTHSETLRAHLEQTERRHQQELAEQEGRLTHAQATLDQSQVRIAVLEKQLLKTDEERKQASERAMSLELDIARAQTVAQETLGVMRDKVEEEHRSARISLQHELQKRDREKSELENELRLARTQEETLRAALSAHDAQLTERYAMLEQSLREKERELDLLDRRLKAESLEKQTELSRSSLSTHQREEKVREEEALLEQRRLQLDVVEKQSQFLRDQLTAALRQTEKMDGNSGGTGQRLVDDWMFGFAHQIRNPLAIIRSTAEALADAKALPANMKALEAIIQSADGLTERLAQFMEFSKPMDPLFKPVSLDLVMRDALVGIRDSFARVGIKVNYTVEEKLPLVPGNANQFQDAFTELLLNALEAMPQGGTLDIRLSYDVSHDQVIATLQDSGRGINADHLTQIGKPFFTTKTGHAGLGLAHAKRVLHLYAGDLKIESPVSEGAQVRCLFRRKGWAP